MLKPEESFIDERLPLPSVDILPNQGIADQFKHLANRNRNVVPSLVLDNLGEWVSFNVFTHLVAWSTIFLLICFCAWYYVRDFFLGLILLICFCARKYARDFFLRVIFLILGRIFNIFFVFGAVFTFIRMFTYVTLPACALILLALSVAVRQLFTLKSWTWTWRFLLHLNLSRSFWVLTIFIEFFIDLIKKGAIFGVLEN